MNSNIPSENLAQSSDRPGRGTDVLSNVLGTLRLQQARYCASDLSAPWGIRFGARNNPIFHVVDRGAAWLRLPDDVPQALVGGDVVLLAHGHAHSLTDVPERPVVDVDFDMHPQIKHGGGPASWGGGGARTLLVCGEFRLEGPTFHSLIAELPACLILRAGDASEWLTMALRLLAHEAMGIEPGSELILGRLVEVIFMQCIRGWLRSGGADPNARQGWLWALRDAPIARALSLMHQNSSQEWTAEELGRQVGLSRSMFCARFAHAVGEPPLTYLTRWRMQLAAARLLTTPAEPLKSVAAAAGYRSEAAFNRVFRRFSGQPPAQWRASRATPD